MSQRNDFSILNKSGQRLAVWHYQSLGKPVKADIIVCHGFSGTKSSSGRMDPLAARMNDLGMDVLAFDFSGRGDSEGDFAGVTLTRQADDLQSMIDYLSGVSSRPLFLLGRSFGGATCLVAASRNPHISAIILWSTPMNLNNTFDRMIPQIDPTLTLDNRISINFFDRHMELSPALFNDIPDHDMVAYARSIGDKPLLVIHGGQDEIADVADSRLLARSAGNVTLVTVGQADHRFSEHSALREEMTLSWLEYELSRIGN